MKRTMHSLNSYKEDKMENKIENQKEESTPDNVGEGDKYETTPVIERAREEREKLEIATKAQKAENDRTESIMARNALGGISEGGKINEPKVETPEEYAEKFQRGEVNPLQDDGAL